MLEAAGHRQITYIDTRNVLKLHVRHAQQDDKLQIGRQNPGTRGLISISAQGITNCHHCIFLEVAFTVTVEGERGQSLEVFVVECKPVTRFRTSVVNRDYGGQ